jgi:hypothetical protein
MISVSRIQAWLARGAVVAALLAAGTAAAHHSFAVHWLPFPTTAIRATGSSQ